jgi:predicted ABC-type transport system involved in lysophospholipase L1 biosynthesis ATPase subunit
MLERLQHVAVVAESAFGVAGLLVELAGLEAHDRAEIDNYVS